MISSTHDVRQALNAGSPVAAGVSGGKDSSALVLALNEYLDDVGHEGDRILVHSDLGRTEWKQSLPKCVELAGKVGWPLHVWSRNAGDMLSRWQGRWAANVDRYKTLRCVKLILPWSTASMRFCTAELKRDVICSNLKKLYSGLVILNAVGIRREESSKRSKMPISKPQSKLTRKSDSTSGLDWNPIIEYTLDDVLAIHKRFNFPLHEAYTKYSMSRVSCSFCILASRPDLLASSRCPSNHDVYRSQVDLEIESGFAFKGSEWLGDIAPHLLTQEQMTGLAFAKKVKAEREKVEGELPKELLYEKGWPTRVITQSESKLVASVRRRVSDIQGIDSEYLDAVSVRERYAELISEKEKKSNV